MNAVRQALKSIMSAAFPPRVLLLHGPRQTAYKPAIALTFDDGPDPIHTPRLLAELDEAGATGTFFVIGMKALRHPDLIRQMAAAGHQIANHTYTHSEPRRTSARLFLDEIQRTDELLEELTGRRSTTVRPPKGELSVRKFHGLWQRGSTIALWNVDPKDYRMTSRDEMDRWSRSYQPQQGDVVLMHDNHPFATEAIRNWRETGLFERCSTVTLDQWLESSPLRPQPTISRGLHEHVA